MGEGEGLVTRRDCHPSFVLLGVLAWGGGRGTGGVGEFFVVVTTDREAVGSAQDGRGVRCGNWSGGGGKGEGGGGGERGVRKRPTK